MLTGMDSEFLKMLLGAGGIATLIKWLHARDNRLESRIQSVEKDLTRKLDRQQARQISEDLIAPLSISMDHLKEKLEQQDTKLDRIIEKL